MNLIPVNVTRAAKRGFIRTGAQSLASAIPTGGVALYFTGDALTAAGVAVGSALVTAVLAGAASALSIIASGIPEEYQAGVIEPVEEEDIAEEEPQAVGLYDDDSEPEYEPAHGDPDEQN